MTARPELCVGAVVVDQQDRLLMIQRAQPPEEGAWSIPGGRVEAGESVRTAVERELAEETGLAGRCGELVGWVEHVGTDHHHVILDFRVQLADPGAAPVAATDARAVEWVPLGELASGSRRLVPGLADFLAHHGVAPPRSPRPGPGPRPASSDG